MDSIDQIQKTALKDIEKAADEEALKSLKIEYLGRKGKLTKILRELKNLAVEERVLTGKKANLLRRELEENFNKKENLLKARIKKTAFSEEQIDVTLPGRKTLIGHLHPLTKIRNEVEEIFTALGFVVAEGPEMETEHYNFDALNIPADHPAREMWDTFWVDETGAANGKKFLLRVHTSPVQIRYMETHQPPFRLIAPGKVFRYEATDASHDIQFYQVEGLIVGKDTSAANFKNLIPVFFKKLFNKEVKIRLRPSYFPFVEPGFEVDMSCIQCAGKGCPVCSRTGWLEIMGAGMVHPNVFKAVGYNPRLWQGIAFGVGLDRIAMMKYKIPDIRFFHANDIRFLKQF
ncbi:MAG: phenylalanine--tRNA ligase subunit alpha [Candidatus Niyogibacteria bacterium]|nr:phenylalanine--tRNA ligase subunit alpha [Candidatus Woesearchaeota archaeon]MBI2627964.1 phenylalanine--tRNA ligase subunit alpha [Candidatus Niyogibacteria bacterium]